MGKHCTGKQEKHVCRACGQKGHRLKTCTSWAAAEIRRLRKVAAGAQKPGKERSLKRARKSGEHRAEAKAGPISQVLLAKIRNSWFYGY